MRRLISIAALSLIVLCAIFLSSHLATSSKAQSDDKQAANRQETNPQNVEQTIGKRMPIDKFGIRRLKEKTFGASVVSINEATGAASFIRFVNNNKNSDLVGAIDSTDAKEKSNAFFREYAGLFGISNPEAELRYESEVGEEAGEKHQTFRQFYNGIPVFAGTLKMHLDRENNLYAVNGTFVPQIEIDTNPIFSPQDAIAAAVAKVSEDKSVDGLFAVKTDLYVYRTGLVKNVPGNDFLTWKVEVTNNDDVREFVFIDAHTNKLVDQFTGIHDALNRRAYNGLGLNTVPPSYPASPFWTEGQAFPTGSSEANNMLTASKETYDLFKNAFNRDSFNGSGATMDSIFNRGYSCPNASWNGTFISFCPGLTTDDITAHEWGHAYTEYTHELIYQWQSGALNESYSDIYGEIVDRINNRDNVGNSATDPARSTGSCSGSTRWLLGEDATGGINGALRDMYNPSCFNDPGKVSDPAYVCSLSDQGGVHSNSGVPNHAFALLVDGGVYNGQTVNGIGLTKAAHIYFRAMNIYQNSDSDFVDHADSVEQSANDLRISGANLPDLKTGLPTGQVITAADFLELQKALLAVQMRTLPTQCNFVPLLAKSPPAETACGAGTTRGIIFANDFEGSTTGWTFGKENTLPAFTLSDWLVTTGLPDNQPGKAFYASDPNVGSCNAATDQSGVRFLKSPVIQIPGGSVTNPILSFDHWIATEGGYDGGQLRISVNGGAFTLVPQANFIYNAHTGTLNSAAGGNTNPRASQLAWSGSDGGSVSGSWGKTMVNLTGLINPGNSVQFRWDFSTDLCSGTFGWYVDNVKVTACLIQTSPPTLVKSFIPTSVLLGTLGTMRFVVNNPNASNGLTGIAFNDTLPNGISVATNTYAACNGTVTTTAPHSVSFTGGALAAAANCTIDVGIGGAQAGVWNNTTGAISSTEGGIGATSNTATLTVTQQSVSGTVSYGTTPAGQAAKYVPDVSLSAAGSVAVNSSTDTNGSYSLNGLGAGNYTVTASKAAQTNNTGISLQDASETAKIVFNQITATTNQSAAADATGNGTVSLQDASEIAKRAFNITSTNIVGQWKFAPATRAYQSVNSNLTGENYEAILVGDVTGNWTAPPADPPAALKFESETLGTEKILSAVEQQEQPLSDLNKSVFLAPPTGKNQTSEKSVATGVTVILPTAQDNANTTVLIPVTVGDLTGLNVTAYDFTVAFDPLILQPASPAFETAGTRTDAAGGYSVFVDPGQPSGKVRIGAFGTVPLSGSGTLIFLRFTVLAGAAATSPLNFDNFIFGEGTPADKTANGTFNRLGPTAAAVSIGGRVFTAEGRAVFRARVALTDQNGEVRTAVTNPFGYYRFTDIAAGGTYFLSAAHKQHQFDSKTISANENLSEVNFIASESILNFKAFQFSF